MSEYTGPDRRRHPTRPDDWLFEDVQALKQDIQDRYDRLRADMATGFAALSAKVEAHISKADLLANRVLTIEVQRGEEGKQAIKQGTWAGILAAAGLTGLWKMVDVWLKLR